MLPSYKAIHVLIFWTLFISTRCLPDKSHRFAELAEYTPAEQDYEQSAEHTSSEFSNPSFGGVGRSEEIFSDNKSGEDSSDENIQPNLRSSENAESPAYNGKAPLASVQTMPYRRRVNRVRSRPTSFVREKLADYSIAPIGLRVPAYYHPIYELRPQSDTYYLEGNPYYRSSLSRVYRDMYQREREVSYPNEPSIRNIDVRKAKALSESEPEVLNSGESRASRQKRTPTWGLNWHLGGRRHHHHWPSYRNWGHHHHHRSHHRHHHHRHHHY